MINAYVHEILLGYEKDSNTHLVEKTEYFVRVMAENKAGTSEPLEGEEAVMLRSLYS